MREIINGKAYDTDTATGLANYNNGYSRNDFKYCDEDLYQKKNGEFFLCGEGGAMTRWATDTGNGRYNGSGLLPLTEDEARQWAERHCDAAQYEAIFGPVEE